MSPGDIKHEHFVDLLGIAMALMACRSCCSRLRSRSLSFSMCISLRSIDIFPGSIKYAQASSVFARSRNASTSESFVPQAVTRRIGIMPSLSGAHS